jgi:hypothetical protein
MLKADAHKVLPSVLRHFPVRIGDAELERVCQEADKKRVEAAALSAMLRYHAYAITKAARALPVAVVKGPLFADLYPTGLRSFGDIDLLALPSALPELASILSDLGFRRQIAPSDHHRLEHAWVHGQNDVLMVEVHTNLVHSPQMRMACSLTYEDLEGNTAAAGALLCVAVVHGTMHHFAWLRHVVDISLAARALTSAAEEAQFEAFVDRARTRPAAVIALSLAYRLFGEVRCLEIARTLGRIADFRFGRVLLEGAVVTAPMEGRVIYNTWRRFVFRELFRQTSLNYAKKSTRITLT